MGADLECLNSKIHLDKPVLTYSETDWSSRYVIALLINVSSLLQLFHAENNNTLKCHNVNSLMTPCWTIIVILQWFFLLRIFQQIQAVLNVTLGCGDAVRWDKQWYQNKRVSHCETCGGDRWYSARLRVTGRGHSVSCYTTAGYLLVALWQRSRLYLNGWHLWEEGGSAAHLPGTTMSNFCRGKSQRAWETTRANVRFWRI